MPFPQIIRLDHFELGSAFKIQNWEALFNTFQKIYFILKKCFSKTDIFLLFSPKTLSNFTLELLQGGRIKFHEEVRVTKIQVFVQRENHLSMKNCIQCGFRLGPLTNKFYCCDKQSTVCSTCRLRNCNKCKQKRLNILQSPKCLICHGRIYDEKAFCDPTCGKYFCPKCLVTTFKTAYQKTLVPNFNTTLITQSFIKLPCGDDCPYNKLLSYFTNYCLQCGKDYRETIDFNLKNDLKLCFMCESYFRDHYFEAFIKCNICGCCIENKSKAGIADQKDLVLCKNCYRQSQIEEKFIEQKKKLNEKQKRNSSVYKEGNALKSLPGKREELGKKQQVKTDTFFTEKKSQSMFVERKFQQTFSEQSTYGEFVGKKSDQNIIETKVQQIQPKEKLQQFSAEKKPSLFSTEKKPQSKQDKNSFPQRKNIEYSQEPKSKIGFFIEQSKQQANQQKRPQKDELKHQQNKQKRRNFEQKEKEKFFVEFKDEQKMHPQKVQFNKEKQQSYEHFAIDQLKIGEEQVDEQIKKQLGITTKLVIKKYMSDETFIENLNLQVLKNKPDESIKCKQCRIRISKKLAYNLHNIQSNKPKSLSLLSVSTNQEALASTGSHNFNYSCRVCYHKSLSDNQSFLKKSNFNDHLHATNASNRSTLQDSRRTANYLKLSQASRTSQRKDSRQSLNPTIKINTSSYGLTGAKLLQHKTMNQNSLNSRHQIKRHQTPLKPTHQKLRVSLNEYKPQRRPGQSYVTPKCEVCSSDRKQLIYSLNGGKYCKECYIRKNTRLFSDHRYFNNIY